MHVLVEVVTIKLKVILAVTKSLPCDWIGKLDLFLSRWQNISRHQNVTITTFNVAYMNIVIICTSIIWYCSYYKHKQYIKYLDIVYVRSLFLLNLTIIFMTTTLTSFSPRCLNYINLIMLLDWHLGPACFLLNN